MPHIIIEHSANFSKDSIINLQVEIQNIMASITEGNFDPDQCKARAHLFEDYLVGRPNQETASFLHITIKILAGRSLEVRKKLGEQVMNFSKKFFEELLFSPNQKDQLIETAHQLADVVSGVPHPQLPLRNSALADKRCDLSVDIVEMEKETYQKVRV
jgi:5-carboxymethyl-2-hydroxymuconate isomerase